MLLAILKGLLFAQLKQDHEHLVPITGFNGSAFGVLWSYVFSVLSMDFRCLTFKILVALSLYRRATNPIEGNYN